jgi:hypothetical protein
LGFEPKELLGDPRLARALLFCRGPADLQSHKKNLEEDESVVMR